MRFRNAFQRFLFQPVCFHVDGDGGGGGAPAPAAAPAAPAGDGAPPATQGSTPPPASPAPAAPAAASPTGLVGPDGKFTGDFAKAFPNLAPKFTSAESLAKSYQNLEHMLGKQGKVSPLTKDSTPEERAAWNKAMDVPSTPNDYGIQKPKEIDGKPLPEGLWNDQQIEGYLGKFHELGLSKSQASELISYGMKSGMAAFPDMQKAVQESFEAGEKQLRADWGSKYEANLAIAERGAQVAGITKDMVANDPVLANNPTFLRAMLAVGALTAEGASPGARGTGSPQVSDPSVRIGELQALMSNPGYKKSGAYLQHDANMSEMRRLIALKDQMRGG